jgi:hypothetical protein
VLTLRGGGVSGANDYQMDLTDPIHVDSIDAFCGNASTDCSFELAIIGNSTGT